MLNVFALCSVTRFGEILALGQIFKSLHSFFQVLFSIWPNFELTLANILCYWVNFHCSKWLKIEQII